MNKFFPGRETNICARSSKLGGDLKCSRNKPKPKWMASKWFRYGFLIFFLAMFGNMGFQTYLVASGSENLREAIKLLIGLIVMSFFKPRTCCAFCPMGTMTQAICKLRNRKNNK